MHIVTERFEIRPIDETWMDSLLEVYRLSEDFLALGPNPQASEIMIKDDFALSRSQGGIFCGIFQQGQMVGVLDVVPHGCQSDPALAFIELLMIARPHRAAGLGAEVVHALEDELRRHAPVTTLGAGVQVNNPGAIRFWLRMGFYITGGPELMPDQTVVYHLRKKIGHQTVG